MGLEIAAAAIGHERAAAIAVGEDGEHWATLYTLAEIRVTLAQIRREARMQRGHARARHAEIRR